MRFFNFLKESKQWRKFCLCFVITLVLVNVLIEHVHLIVNRSVSLPYKTFIQFSKVDPEKGDYTLVDSSWFGGRLIKQIVGTEGDKISYTSEGELKVGEKIIGTQKSKSKDGRDLKSIEAGVIPRGYVFLYAPHESSFDSRYQELGLVPVKVLQGTAYPIHWREQ